MITQIILAAGLSSRMGSPKPLLDFDGVPLLALLLAECRRSLVDQVMVVLGHEWERISERIDLSGVAVAVNENYRSGQTGSLQCGLRMLDKRTQAFLNLPVDHPLVTHEEIDAIVKAYRSQPTGAAIVVPVFQGREGRPVLFDRALREEILALRPDEPVKSILQKHRNTVRHVAVENPFTMTDVDTPQQYRECLRLFRALRQEGGGG